MINTPDINAEFDAQLAQFIASHPFSDTAPDDSQVQYPFVLAMYRKNKPRLKKGKPALRNTNTLIAVLIRKFGDLSVLRPIRHHGFTVMAMSFTPSMYFIHDHQGPRYEFKKVATWEHLRPMLLPGERFLVDEMEKIYPSYYLGQLTLPI